MQPLHCEFAWLLSLCCHDNCLGMPTAGIRSVRRLPVPASEEWWNSRRMLWVGPLILISCELFSTTVRKFSSAEYLRMMRSSIMSCTLHDRISPL